MSKLMSFGKRFSEDRKEQIIKPTVSQMQPVPEPKEDFFDFIKRVAPWYRIYNFNERLIWLLQVAYMEGGWWWINLPPRSGKTILLQLFCAWIMSEDPLCDIGYCSYGQRLANKSTKAARDYYTLAGGLLDDSSKSKIEWQTTGGGMMWASGPGGSVRGSGYHVGIVDDLHKNSRELLSEVKVDGYQDFWANTWLNRAQAHTHRPILRLVVGQRLADNDIFGYIKELADEKGDGDKWTCIVDDVIKSDEELQLPNGANLIEDERQLGENIEPLVFTPEVIATNSADPDEYDAQFQQRPRQLKGTILDASLFKIISPEMVPKLHAKVAGIDLAIRKTQRADYTVAMPLGFGLNQCYYFFRPWRDKKESPSLRREIPIFLLGHRVIMAGVDPTAFQASFVQELRANPSLGGVSIVELPMKGVDRTDKEVMARSWSPLVEQRLVYLVEDGSGWTEKFLDEIRKFPRGQHDDQVDAAGYAIHTLRMIISSVVEDQPADAS